MSSKLEFFKSQFYRSDKIHLNNAGLALPSLPSIVEVKYWADRFYQEGFYTDHDYMDRVSQTRKNLSRIIGCEHDEIAFFQATSGAVSQLAFSVGLKPGDEVITWDQEYASNLYPWQEACHRSGAKHVIATSNNDLSTPFENILKCITANTKVIAISWVQFQAGAMTDIRAITDFCKGKNILVFVDVIQGLGLFPFDFKALGVDAVVGGSHKWLHSPVGVGYLAIRKELALKMRPMMIGSSTYGTCDDPSDLACIPKRDASKFEPGSKQVLEITALGKSVEFILDVGVELISQEANRWAAILRDGLIRQNYSVAEPLQKQKTPFVNFTHPQKTTAEIKTLLNKNNITCALRGPGVRLTPAAYNSDSDIQKTLEILK